MLETKGFRVVEYFCGENKSFSKVAEERGHTSFTIDFNEKTNPSLCIDILKLDINKLPQEFRNPDIFWASPDCTQFSKAKTRGERNIKLANELVLKTLKDIKLLNPKIWFIENPQTGLLRKQPILNEFPFKQLPYFDVSYCKYGLPYRKQTRIWTNLEFKGKICNKDCKFMIGKKHIDSAGNGTKKYSDKSYTKAEKHQIPKELCLELIKCCENKLEIKQEIIELEKLKNGTNNK